MVRHTFTVLFVLILAAGFLPSCEEPLIFEEPLPLSSKLVVVSNFTEGRAILVKVSKSRLIGDTMPEEYLTNAEVDLYWNDVFLERLSLVIPKNPDQPPYYRTFDNIPVAGQEYTLKVAADGYQTVMAKSLVPPSVKITRFELARDIIETVPETSTERLHFTATVDFDDPIASVNYYHLNISQQINNFLLDGRDTVVTKSFLKQVVFNPLNNRVDISANSGELGGGLLFADKPDNKALGISFSVELNPASQLLGKTYVELRTLSKDYYLFYTSVNKSEGGNQNPLVDPVIVYENVVNGHGIFAGYSNSTDSIQVAQ